MTAPDDALRRLRWVRRALFVLCAATAAWFFARFGTRWVPAGMDTVAAAPPGSWCIVDRWASGLRVGSDVFVDSPAGMLLSRVKAVDAETVTIEHPNPNAPWPDSRQFGALPRRNVASVVLVVFPADAAAGVPSGR